MTDSKTIIKNASILFVITLVAGLLLGLVYQITKEPIRQQEILAQTKANQAVFADAQSFDDVDLDAAVLDSIISSSEDYKKITINSVKAAKDANGNVLGYVLQIQSMGYGDKIVYTAGITNDGVINGISIISIAETPGLGMNAEPVLVPQFADKPAVNFSVTKTAPTSNDQIQAISGATITSKAVTRGVNVAVMYFEKALKGGAQ